MAYRAKDYKRVQAEKIRYKRELQKQITELNKQRDEIFSKWVFKKAMDEDFIRKEGIRIYTAIKQSEAQYDAV